MTIKIRAIKGGYEVKFLGKKYFIKNLSEINNIKIKMK